MDRRLRRDVAWNLVPVALLGVVGLGLNFAIGGWWGPAALGVFNQVTTAFFVVSVLGAGGLQYSVLRAVAEDPEDRGRVAAVVVGALVPTCALAVVSTAAFVLVAPAVGRLLDSPDVAAGMLWAAPGLFCFALNKVLFGVVNGLRRMRAFAVYTSLRYILIAVGLVIAHVYGATPEQLPVIWTFTEGALLLVLAGELIGTVALARCAGWTRWVRDHVSFGVRGVASTLAFELNSKLDVWILGVVFNDASVGVYSLASVLAGELIGTVALARCAGWTRWVRDHVSFGVRGVASTLAFELNSKLDVWILGVVFNDSSVGVYSLASVLAEGVMQLGVVVQNNLNPLMAKALAAGDKAGVRAVVVQTRKWFVPALAGACVLGAICYPYVIPFVIGDASFADGAPAFAILVGGIALSAPWLPFSQVLLMASRPGWHTLLVLLVVGLNFSGNVLLIPVMGMEGAATATAVTLVLSMVLLVRIARTRAGVQL